MESNFLDRCKSATCRSCQHRNLSPILDLGPMPHSDGLLREHQLQEPEPRYPLELAFCPECTLVQILETVPPETLFCDDYPYYSSFSDYLLRHSRENALELIASRGLTAQSQVVELASNDGYLLKNFVEKGIPVLGIDPARGPATAAEKVGVPTLCTFFTRELAAELKQKGKSADVIVANNVLAHVPDTNGFVAGLKILLKENGIASIEVPYVRDLIDHGEFDTIYHQHLCYFSVHALDRLFRRHGLYLNAIRHVPIHGGSLRLYVEPHDQVDASVKTLLEQEKTLGLDRLDYYAQFAARVHTIRKDMVSLLSKLKSEGKRIAAYGAAAKGAIMLNYLGVGTETIDYVVDRNVHKQGRFMPGVHLPISDPARLLSEKPDYCVILPWNFRDEILEQQSAYRQAGGKFIVPIPKVVVV